MNESEILNAVSFPVKMMEAGFRTDGGEWVGIANRKAVVNTLTNEALGIHSNYYKLIPYASTTDVLMKTLKEHGGSLVVREGRGKRANPLQMEGNGKRIWIESKFEDRAITIGKDRIMPRLMYGNSYDGTLCHRLMAGFFQINCTNIGAVIRPGRIQGFGGLQLNQRHIGGHDVNIDGIGHHIAEFLDAFPTFAERMNGMANTRVDKDSAMKLLEKYTGCRFTEKNQIDSQDVSAWDLYAKITNYLTFDYKGGVGPSEKRASQALIDVEITARSWK